MASKKQIVDCICCWYDFLGFGSPFVDAGWDLTNKIADKSIDRICSEAIDFRGFYSFADKTTRFHCNDGIATNYDLEQGKENELERLKIITFLDGIITDYEIINATDKSNGYPGVRGVLTAGHRLNHYDAISLTEMNGRIVSYHPKEFQLNTAFSKASIVEESGSRHGIHGPVLYVDKELFSMLRKHGFFIAEEEIDDAFVFSVSNGAITLYTEKETVTYDYKGISTVFYKLKKKFSYIDEVYETPKIPDYGSIQE